MIKAQREIKLKLNVLNHAKTSKNVALSCRRFGISRQSFYTWKANYEKYGEDGLINCVFHKHRFNDYIVV